MATIPTTQSTSNKNAASDDNDAVHPSHDPFFNPDTNQSSLDEESFRDPVVFNGEDFTFPPNRTKDLKHYLACAIRALERGRH